MDSLRADLADPAAILASPEVTQTLDLNRPVAAIFGMVLHFFDAAEAAKIVAVYTGALAGGSHVVISCGSGDEETDGRLASEYNCRLATGTQMSRGYPNLTLLPVLPRAGR